MDTADPLDSARARLIEARRVIRAELGEEIEPPGQMTYGSQAAAASHVFAQQRDLALRDQAERRLKAVEHAIARLDTGRYATCEICGGPIAPERHEAVPWAATCVECGRTHR